MEKYISPETCLMEILSAVPLAASADSINPLVEGDEFNGWTEN